MPVPDLGELAYGSGDAVVLSKLELVGPGDAADLPINCDPGACSILLDKRKLCQHHNTKNFQILNLKTYDTQLLFLK